MENEWIDSICQDNFPVIFGKKHRRKTSNASEETKASTIEKKNRGRAVAWKT